MSIEQKLELARMELLDMGLRGNPLLSIPKTLKFLELVEERSTDVFGILVNSRKPMSFLPLPGIYEDDRGSSSEDDEALPTLYEYLQETAGDDRFTDRFLQTGQPADRLDTCLLKIENEAHTLLQEQGIDVLHLALGVLEWFEDPNARTPRLAPLLLIPVELGRETARSGFTVNYTDVELSPNLTLAAKLSGEFRVNLPEFSDEFAPDDYFAAVEKAIAEQANWKVRRDTMYLGLFSSGKFQMYMDLDPVSWPKEASLSDNRLLGKVLESGFVNDGQMLERVDQHRDIARPEALHLVKDADSSQLAALIAAMEGANLVVQGPPGTGKSQTITNLIAEAVSRGKKVLFVAQKMAALDVVKSRLDECHLGEAVLELHSHKTSKKAVLESLKSAFQQGKPEVPSREFEYRRLGETREKLDTYAKEISRPILNSDLNYLQALGEMLKLQKKPALAPLKRIRFELLKGWSQEDLQRAVRTFETVESYLSEFGAPSANVFEKSGRCRLSPSDEQDIQNLVGQVKDKLTSLRDECDALTDLMHLPDTNTFDDIDLVHKAGQRALQAPHLQGVKVSTQAWQLRRDDIRELVGLGQKLAGMRISLGQRFIEAAFSSDLLPIRMGLAGRADKWWRIFSSAYRHAKSQLRGYIQGNLEGKPTQWLEWVDLALVYQVDDRRFGELAGIGELLFGAQWQGKKSDWGVLARISEWIFSIYDEIGAGDLPEGLTDFLEANPDIKGRSEQIEALAGKSQNVCSLLGELVDSLEWSAGFNKTNALAGWAENLEDWQNNVDQLYPIVRFNQLEGEIKAVGLGSLIPDVREWQNSPRVLVDWLKLSFCSGLVDTAYSEADTIGKFDRVSHERLIEEFSELDKATLNYAQEELVRKLHASLPSFNAPGEMDIIRREISKKRRHIPIRRLISEAGNVIQQAKPVFMMSPMSVATYLPQGKLSFDLVIFDEASQIPAPEALGAIARGSQAIVVGDSKQMPPSDFFRKAVEISDEDAEMSVTADVESILGMMQARGAPESMLSWHYRSRHQSLIAVSNDQFYDNKLLIFPTSGANPYARGLSMTHLTDAIYDRGKSRANLIEAKAVAEAVLEHAKVSPQLSLGVVAFSTAQREVIMMEVERLRREHPETEQFFQRHIGGDGFFIKNLENVQGDERDVIFISIGYGKTAAGNLSQNFGPLNGKGGERRLNVLISRAKLAMRVFANFRGDEVRTDAESPFGVRALKVFLNYAETGNLPVLQETGREPDSPFELDVKAAIESLGYEVEAQVGCQGYFIDLAVVDPSSPGRYLLAVECDGASYHSSSSARERDRLRQAVLEGLGWRFHRIWSTEWFRNAGQEIGRIKVAIGNAENEQQSLDRRAFVEASISAISPDKKGPDITRGNVEQQEKRVVPAYMMTPQSELGLRHSVTDFLEISVIDLKNAIRNAAEKEGPIHISVLTSRLVNAVGLSRAGQRIQQRVAECVNQLERNGGVHVDGEFVRASSSGSVQLRDWSDLPSPQRKFEFVSPDELSYAMLLTVKDAYSVDRESCMGAALNLIGFKRLTETIKARMDGLLDDLISQGQLVEVSGRLQVA
jgi:very-short-patch-repair endonuclease/DNA polymerase III delta prime subunit